MIRAALLAIVVACGGHPPPPPVANTRSPATPPPAPASNDALGSFTTSSVPQAVANGLGSVRGTLATKNQEPMIGATIVLESSVLQGEQVAIADERGTFALDKLPAGRYRVSVYYGDQTVQRSFEVATDRTTRLVFADWDETFGPHPPIHVD